MDDLSGLNWTPSSGSEARRSSPVGSAPPSRFSELRPTPPMSGRSTPLTFGPSVRSKPPSKATTPANDSFANLVSFNSANSGKTLSLLEQQKQLAEQRARKEEVKRANLETQYGGSNTQFWDNFEKPRTSASPAGAHTFLGQRRPSGDEDDLLAAFNASAPVDASTNFPIPVHSGSSSNNTSSLQLGSNDVQATHQSLKIPDDDDPFGLRDLKLKATSQNLTPQTVDDDILGSLGKPVSEFTQKQKVEVLSPKEAPEKPSPPVSTEDKYIAELVDMGFPADKAQEALAATESGIDVQAAVGWLLNQAHEEAKQKAKNRGLSKDQHQNRSRERSSGGRSPERRDNSVPAWMQNESSRSSSNHAHSPSPSRLDKDPAALAAELRNTLFKSANSLWKSGTKKMQQAVQEFNGPSDSNQPRWMRESSSTASETTRSGARGNGPPHQGNFTDEALLLESGARPTKSPRRREESYPISNPDLLRSRSPRAPVQRDTQPQIREGPRTRLTRVNAEEQAAQAYVSPARRRKAAPTPTASESQPNLFDTPNTVNQPARPATTSPHPQTRQVQTSKPLPVRPRAPPREIPQISSSALASSHSSRQKGSEAFKRGDYASAHTAYSTALSHLPEKHPLTAVILCNRALTGLKIGEPKSAIADADTAMAIIGPSRGESEKIDLAKGEPSKDMKEVFGKALMRKAEALEQLERWSDAAKIWRDAVESGHGGSTSIQGRNRCEKAAGMNQPTPHTSTPVTSTGPVKPRKPVTPAARPIGQQSKPAEAVSRLRAANEAADRADNEKFALSDSVEARITAWKSGKQDNLRALLASLDTVLWPEAAWKTISMAELILPNKVKIHYMKGIAKVHPDKIPVNATTEQKMIAGAVFSALNEAWDKFKNENGL
ncbi:UBA/TS-N domain-containing protein [Histoplasma capsulatum G186AR]|uniref:UBA/TS-N domain-containing protein n=2 Tax=Ajellomyces capsulatus TaxID=5037 RepID=C0NTW7_AJECG|nr:UBA/TS-N domain-containing protein [Histoplasma capsulatum G186AR]EEH05478.1 UBA/TS-N domain-containing protein [Histoplasma capsulatum G186AR]KAG5305154.1 UBA/TS-N domain-containing protein [Histoplasma capsulatum]QSS76114.1 UBA/TS-N domain-containing protein [Histoplasma capsulatum G186AR]